MQLKSVVLKSLDTRKMLYWLACKVVNIAEFQLFLLAVGTVLGSCRIPARYKNLRQIPTRDAKV